MPIPTVQSSRIPSQTFRGQTRPELDSAAVQEHLAKTLLRASAIASCKAVALERRSRKQQREGLRRTFSGIALTVIGVLGTFLATLLGVADMIGLTPVLLSGLFLVFIGTLLLLATPTHSKRANNRYAKQAEQLAQLSRSVSRA